MAPVLFRSSARSLHSDRIYRIRVTLFVHLFFFLMMIDRPSCLHCGAVANQRCQRVPWNETMLAYCMLDALGIEPPSIRRRKTRAGHETTC